MAFDIVNLVSDDEDDSPNKAAQSVLKSFAPRKDRRASEKSVSRNGFENRSSSGRDLGLKSPERNGRAVLNSFRPRKERKAQSDSLSSGQESSGGYGGRPTTSIRNGVGNLPGTHNNSGAHNVSLRKAGRGVEYPDLTSKSPRASLQHRSEAPRINRRPDAGSLVALLQDIQRPQAANGQQNESYRISPARPDGSSDVVEERRRQADAFYERRSNQQQRSRSGQASSKASLKPIIDRDSTSPPVFKLPNLRSPIAQPASAPRQAPIAVTDLLEGNKDKSLDDLGDFGSYIRPFKRPRLSESNVQLESVERDRFVPEAPLSCRKTKVNGNVRNESYNKNRASNQSAVRHLSPELRLHGESKSNADRFKQQVLGSTATPRKHDVVESTEQEAAERNMTPRRSSSGLLSPDIAATAVQGDQQNAAKVSRSESSLAARAPAPASTQGVTTSFGNQYTSDEDALLADLKEVRKLRWDDMLPYFSGRTKGSLQVRYSTKVGKRKQQKYKPPTLHPQRSSPHVREDAGSDSNTGPDPPARVQRKKRNVEASAASGMISWAEVGRRKQLLREEADATRPQAFMETDSLARQFTSDRARPKSVSSILRQRELDSSGRGVSGIRSVPTELREHIFDNFGPLKYHKGTSGDVTCLAWSPDGRSFAAGSIAISDERSMQYNLPGNLIVGDYRRGQLHELPEHHVMRPPIESTSNVNSLPSMRESQDPRLFMTVANVQFSPDGSTLYSAGSDSKVRAYSVSESESGISCSYEIEHPAPLDLLSISNLNILATACHQSSDGSIGIYQEQEHLFALSPSRAEQQTSRAIYPSALRWGASPYHSNLLLAGFSIDSIDEERDIAGETCLWDIATQQRIQVPVTRNVFDVAWNPRPTSTSTVFAIASTPGTQKVTRGTRTVVQCFAPNQGRVSRVLEWESPAFDINDVMYCQHDDNLIAAGATDGKIYIWDQRFAGHKRTPLHILEHGDSLNVLDHDREREIADTGVRFLSWGATSTRLYTGSSDGTVKIWNPYMATENAHIKDVATFGSAVMSGAFSPDYRDLLIGEDQGRINSLSIGHEDKTVRSMRKFDFVPAPAPQTHEDPFLAADELLQSQQIAFRPMGDLPVRQAVQGLHYSGPYIAPTAQEMEAAEENYDDALVAQSKAHVQFRLDPLDDSLHNAHQEAVKRVQESRRIIARLQRKANDTRELYAKAEQNQRELHKAEKRRDMLEASLSRALDTCKLDCNYLPADVDGDGNVADSRRSERRIPDILRSSSLRDTTMLTPEELLEAGLTAKCIACSGPAARPKSGFPLCSPCARARRGLTAKCARCSAPVCSQTESKGPSLCEQCNFACFRCGEVSLLSKDRNEVKCEACDSAWRIGVLGYELVKGPEKRGLGRRSANTNPHHELEFGEDEMERHASRWGGTT